jgi:Ca-activated chloride channel family protein
LAALAGLRARSVSAERSHLRAGLRRGAFGVALLLALVAALGPVFGEAQADGDWQGADVVVCLDISRSMLAPDTPPSRLDAAKASIEALLAHADGTRFGLVLFAGDAQLRVPLTRDRQGFRQLLALAEPANAMQGGTDLGKAIDVAQDALSRDQGRAGVVLVVSDGEDLRGRGLAAAEQCQERGLVVHALGLGTALGSKIPLVGEVGFLRDRSGSEVVTALDPAGLQAIARAANGQYRTQGAIDKTLPDLHDQYIVPLARAADQGGEHRRRSNGYQWPLLLATLLWLAELFLLERRR